jgi:aspartyl-tRNA(Asn)/glutamyl-tRNA(Gln) amidotransferase subunit A
MAPLNLGSDAGGSVRIPAAFCGVVGIKPSPGLMPGYPPSVFSTLSSIGPLTRSVDDAVLILDVLARAAQTSSIDFHALPASVAQAALAEPALPKANAGLRVAVIDRINGIKLSPECQKTWDAQKKHFAVLGKVERIDLDVPNLAECFNGHWTATASLMASGMHAKDRKKLDARFMHWVERGDAQHLHDYMRAEYDRMIIGGQFKDLLTSYDLLITPTTPFAAFDVGIDMPVKADKKPFFDWNIFNAFANLARLPALSMPLGLTADGLPLGVQICAGYLRDGLLIAAARRLEVAIDFKDWLTRQEA